MSLSLIPSFERQVQHFSTTRRLKTKFLNKTKIDTVKHPEMLWVYNRKMSSTPTCTNNLTLLNFVKKKKYNFECAREQKRKMCVTFAVNHLLMSDSLFLHLQFVHLTNGIDLKCHLSQIYMNFQERICSYLRILLLQRRLRAVICALNKFQFKMITCFMLNAMQNEFVLRSMQLTRNIKKSKRAEW